MTTEQKRTTTPPGPTDAERLWFAASDRFYYLLEKEGRAQALKAAAEVLDVLPPLPEQALRMRGLRAE